MLDHQKRYWKGLEELNQSEDFVKSAKSEFSDVLPEDSEAAGTYRRDFLKMMGFGVAAASLAACESPVRKAIPYLIKPEEVDPSVPNWYASTYADGGDYCSIVVKTREGRPVKIEGNKNSSVSQGGISARVAASVLSLYDKERYRSALSGGNAISWEQLDQEVSAKLAEVASSGKSIRIVANTIVSPSLNQALNEFTSKYANSKVVSYDADSASGLLIANQKSFGKYTLPSYDFSSANVIVGIGCDFLGTWLSPVEFAKQYSKGRKIGKEKKVMSRHYQFESMMSLTGSNADFRSVVKPSEEALVAISLYNLIAAKAGAATLNAGDSASVKFLDKAAEDLWASKGNSLVVSGSNIPEVQVIVNAINSLLGNYGKTVNIDADAKYRKGNDAEMSAFVEDLKNGKIGAVIFLNANPVYNHSSGKEIKAALSQVDLTLSTSDRPDETAAVCKFVAPNHHYLESWSDAEIKSGVYSLGQPAITPLFKTRNVIESVLAWSGKKSDAYSYIKSYWTSALFGKQSKIGSTTEFWDLSLQNGVFESGLAAASSVFAGNVQESASVILSTVQGRSSDIEYIVYQKVGMGTGSQANNPWLQEFPEPVSKACWDNYACLSVKFAKEKGLNQGDLVKVTSKDGSSVELPVLIQPGLSSKTVAFAMGYGREVTGKAAKGVGKNVYSFLSYVNNTVLPFGGVASLSKIEGTREIAQTQTHQTMMSRPIVQESVLSEYVKNPAAGREIPTVKTAEGEKRASDISIWDTKGNQTHTFNNHFWGLAIDLNSCTGCGSCVISCQSENNVPVVGREEVINRREMHWIRIDRYYTSDAEENETFEGLRLKEDPSDNPRVVFQPVMCQHCNNAPCETVCPVLATTHSTEGLNQMTYNRCVGTRYCANNCPYKVRRFNWFKYYENTKFDYNMNDDLGKMVLNPDVTVRARGVMEKCSMCVQRIQAGKLAAKIEKRRPVDGEIETACSQSCPSDAIVFGDMNDPESRISKILSSEKDGRSYYLLEELNVKPSVSYLTKIRNV